MDKDVSNWFKVSLLWVASVLGNVFSHLTLGTFVLLATLVLTCLQSYKVWLDIRWRKCRDRDLR